MALTLQKVNYPNGGVMQQEQLKTVGDVLSLGTVVGTIAGYLPAIAALFTIFWTVMRMVNEWPQFSKKVKSLINRFRRG